MRRGFRFFIYILFLLLTALTIFYFWASAPTLPKDSYSKIIEKSIASNVSNDSIFKIMTYNVGYLSGMTNNKSVKREKELFDSNLDKLKQKLNLYNPDIIAFQEIDFDADRSFNIDQMAEVSTIGYAYGAQAINWDERYLPFPSGWPSNHFGKVISGQSVNSKYEIIWQDRKVLQRVKDSPFYRDAFYLDRLAQVVKIKINNKILVVINIHLEAYDQPTREAQAKTVLDIYNSYKNDFPTILLGDFNSNPEHKDAIINNFLKLGNIGNAAFDTNTYEATFSSEAPLNRIDYILFNTNFIEYVDGKVLNNFGDISDHLPLEMSFKLK